MRTFKIGILSLLTVLGLAGAGAGLYSVGYELGYNEVAYADPGPELIAQALLDAGTEPGPGPAAAAVGVEPVQPSIVAPDPIESPQSAIDLGRTVWQRGGWQFAVVLCWVLSAFVVKRLEPKDGDGDGKPDPVGWKGKTWAIAFGLLAVLGPAAAVALGAPGAAWAGVLPGIPVLIAAVMDVANPKRGAAKGGA
jgi:hypothetical protein